MRNRIVHRGYRPGPSEAADTLNAVNQFVNWVADLLAARASQFPRTASMMVTPDRMRRQNVPERVITTIDGLARTEPPWKETTIQLGEIGSMLPSFNAVRHD